MSFYFYEIPAGPTGTAITADFSVGAEFRSSILREGAAPTEWQASQRTDRQVASEWLASDAADGKVGSEWLRSTLNDTISGFEVGSGVLVAQQDALAPIELLSTRVIDALVRSELTRVVIRPSGARLEWSSNVFADGVPLSEWLSLLLALDATVPLEWGTVSGNPTLRWAGRVQEQVNPPLGGQPFAVSIVPQWQLSGPAAGYQTFGNIPGIVSGDLVYITARDNNGNVETDFGSWEPGTLHRGTPIESSNGGAPCQFVGPVTVFCDVPALYFTRQISQKQVTASGNSQATATPLVAIDNIVTVAAAGSNDVLLDASFDKQEVVNATGAGLNVDVWPPVGHQINGKAANVSVFVEDGNAATFRYLGGGMWIAR